jgi:hypothetical protein
MKFLMTAFDERCRYESILLVVVAILVLWAYRTLEPALAAVRRRGCNLARRPWASLIALGASVVAVRVALLGMNPVPLPHVTDEFSLLLGGATFALGRLTNPAHLLWQHFESFNIIQQPTYMSMYPPAQAVVLAIGIWLGHAWIGVLLSMACMCVAVVWMLRAWMPRSYAFLGGCLVATRFGVSGYWIDSYWGGTVAATGAAILLGAFGRLWFSKTAKRRHAFWAAVGIAIVVNRRPAEGGLLCGIVIALMGYWFLTRVHDRRWQAFWRMAWPMAAVLVPTSLLVGYFNWRVTGSAFLMPYVLGIKTYLIAGLAIWMPARPEPTYRHAVMKEAFRDEFAMYLARKERFIGSSAYYVVLLWQFYLGPALSIPLCALPWALRGQRVRPMVLVLLIGTAVLATETFMFPHYVAPFAPILWLMLLQCIRHMRRWHPRWGTGLVVASLIASCAVSLGEVPVTAVTASRDSVPFAAQRKEVQGRLESLGGTHLVLVRYLPGHSYHEEWVYNEPDIDRSRIVWAREMGREADVPLLSYFHDRHVWILEVGRSVRSFTELTALEAK